MKSKNTPIHIMWVPGHMQIIGNENADKAAKAATKKPLVDDLSITNEDCKHKVKRFIKNCRMDEWNAIPPNNKLKMVKDNPSKRQFATGRSRREETVLCRLRIGHTRMTHRYLIEKTDPPCVFLLQC